MELFKWYLYSGESKFVGHKVKVVIPFKYDGGNEYPSFACDIWFREPATKDNIEYSANIGTYTFRENSPFLMLLTSKSVLYKTFKRLEPLLNKCIIDHLFKYISNL
jgi:hypothetical protein